MSESKYVIFNNSRGPITLTLYRQSEFDDLSKYASHRRRKEARKVFKSVVIPSNSSKDLVAETGLTIDELKVNPELCALMGNNKLTVVSDSDTPIVNLPPKVISEPIPELTPEPIPEEVPEFTISDIIEEVVDPEELRKEIIKDSDFEERGDGDDEEPVVEDKKEKHLGAKRGRKAKNRK